MSAWNTGTDYPLQESGALARARALACEIPDWHDVVRCTVGGPAGTTLFVYADGREFVLPGMVEVTGGG